jgi:hypothetical protein
MKYFIYVQTLSKLVEVYKSCKYCNISVIIFPCRGNSGEMVWVSCLL